MESFDRINYLSYFGQNIKRFNNHLVQSAAQELQVIQILETRLFKKRF